MKNITLSIDEEVLTAVRRYASEHNSSGNALVRVYLTPIAARENRARKARQKIRDLSDQSSAWIGSRSWTHDDLHER
ncbi:MAG: hypothetical protein C4527_27885 [Candidatus Omnitrophota bacterium]|nr:MAG: hypothetical protein C4527_27885 [Candidatus Omnitrophota bacterium]